MKDSDKVMLVLTREQAAQLRRVMVREADRAVCAAIAAAKNSPVDAIIATKQRQFAWDAMAKLDKLANDGRFKKAELAAAKAVTEVPAWAKSVQV